MKSFIKKKTKVLVTGGAGYIGSHTCKLLKINGFEPIVFDNFSSGKKKFIKWGKYFKGDTKNIKDLDKVIKKFKPKAVIHFAANISVAESKLYPKKYYENNLFGTINLLEIMKKNKIKFLIFSSTAALYGNSKKKIINEDEPLLPVNPYGFSKLFWPNCSRCGSRYLRILFYHKVLTSRSKLEPICCKFLTSYWFVE